MNYYESVSNKLKRLDINNIETNDIDAWKNNKKFRKIYNKLWLTDIQNINCGPVGIVPEKFPIVVKPIINLYGMSKGFKICYSLEEYNDYKPIGYFWMEYFEDINYNLDIILNNGKIINYLCLISKPENNGTFDYHYYYPEYKLSDENIYILEQNLQNYTGPINIEIIKDNIIECHLRLNGDSYFYNDKFFINLSKMIKEPLCNFEIKINLEIFYILPYFVKSNFNLDILNCLKPKW